MKPPNGLEAVTTLPPPLSPNQRAWRRFRADGRAVGSVWFLSAVIGLALLGPFFTGHDPNASGDAQYAPPGISYWCGTDVHGRDLFTRLLVGTRISLLVGAIGAGVALVIGVCWGMIAAYLG